MDTIRPFLDQPLHGWHALWGAIFYLSYQILWEVGRWIKRG